MKLKLTYLDSDTQEQRTVTVNTPVAIGYDVESLPKEIDGQNVAHLLVFDTSINPYHALIVEKQGQIVITDADRGYPIGISKDRFTVGKVKFTFEILSEVLSPELVTSGVNGSTESNNSSSSGRCQKMVGFLFKRPCDRTSFVDCPHCDYVNDSDDYESDYVYYNDYGDYDTWGRSYYRDRHYYHYDNDSRRVEFTEADNVAFEEEGDLDFEKNYSAS